MTNKRDTSGNAFPGESADRYFPGMTLRQWYAGQALAGFIGALSLASTASRLQVARENGLPDSAKLSEIAASMAFGYADSMIAEGNKP